MRTLPMIPTTAQLRSLESDWIKKCAHSWGQVLMELAGKAASEVAFRMWLDEPGEVVVVCGRGNNGGDGLVVARYLKLWDVPVSVFIAGSGDKTEMNTEEARTNKKIAEALGIECTIAPEHMEIELDNASLIVDALLGTGLDRQVEGTYRNLIDAINRSGRPVLAIDLPSGLNSDTGQIMGCAVRADRTVTFGYLKPGLIQHPGATQAGNLSCIDIGLPDIADEVDIFLTTAGTVRRNLPTRPDDSHKGTYGSVLMIGGSAEMFGAPALAGHSALRAGAGLCLVAAPKSVVPHLPPAEMIYKMLPETEAGSISQKAVATLEAEIEKASAIIVGPGLSQDPDTVKFVQTLLVAIADSGKPCVVDADALNAIAKDPAKFPKNGDKFVLTPHPKELSRLMGNSVAQVQEDRISSARKAATKYGCTVVLKGSRTVTATNKKMVHINPTGNAGMATGGSGDVLSGIIGGLLAQGMPPDEAAVTGVYVHGMAGDIAASEIGEVGIVAGDISNHLPDALAHIREGAMSALEMQLLGIEPE